MSVNFETEVAKAYNKYFKEHNITALAYRFEKSTRFTIQPCDVLIDSPSRESFYYAIECKSMTSNGKKPLYFSSNFSDKGAKPQMERIYEFCELTGRIGHLAVELKEKPERQAYVLPLQLVFSFWSNNRPAIPLDVIRTGKPLLWNGTWGKGHYELT